MRIEASYATVDELAADVDSQLGKGGLLVRSEAPSGLQQFAAIDLIVRCATAEVLVPAQVLQTFPGVGVAVSIDAVGRARIIALLDAAAASVARLPAVGPTPDGEVEPVEPDTLPKVPPIEPPTIPTATPVAAPAAPMLAKIQRALNGDREARFAVLRDPNRNLHAHVLRNPGIAIDEIAAIARMTTVSVDVLKTIASKREWGHRPEIAIALVRNPTVPIPVAIELVDHVNEGDLRQLAKDTRTREPVARAARKKLIK